MQAKIMTLLVFLNACWQQRTDHRPKRGKPQAYSEMSFVIIFMRMQLKGIGAFKAMHKWTKTHHRDLGWTKAPDRKTIRRRFLALPSVLHLLMPAIAHQCLQLDYARFGFACSFADKSVFRALGGLWHKKHRLLKVVPHSSIDTEASWAKSAYHGWRFGYGLHLICNRNRFPLMATVTTASTKDYRLLEKLIAPLTDRLGLVVADSGYFAGRFLQAIYDRFSVLVTTPCLFKVHPRLNRFQQHYNEMAGCVIGRLTYSPRKASIEPVCAHIKELTGLSGKTGAIKK